MNILRRCYLTIRYRLFRLLLPFPKIHTNEETLEKLLHSNLSMARFGDGEFHMINQTEHLGFQNMDDRLSQRLRAILSSNSTGCMICIPFGLRSVKHLNSQGSFFWRQFVVFHYRKYIPHLNYSRPYYDACVTRPYIDWLDKSHSGSFFSRLKGLWKDKNILIVEGERSRLGVGNDLFSGAASIGRIITLAQQAFTCYDALLAETSRLAEAYDLVLLALGPTATVLAYDLSQLGLRALDIGHVDIEYEWFLQKASKKVAIPGKYVNEVKGGDRQEYRADQRYEQEIVSRIFTP